MTHMRLVQFSVLMIVLIAMAMIGGIGCNTKPTETSALETKISGKVVDKDNNNALTDVQITTSPSTSSVSTDGNGNYTIQDVKAGQYVVSASKSGYTPNSITVLVTEGKTASADVKLETLKPVISVSVVSLDFGTTQTTATLTISNATSVGAIAYSIAKSVDWLSVSASSGTVSTGNATITITASRTNLSFGNYNTTLSITSNAGNKDIPITMTVVNPNAPQLTVSPLVLEFGQDIASLAFNIRNTGTSKLDWTASSPQPWIAIQPGTDSTRTETDLVTLTINRNNLPPADYTGSVLVNSNAGSQTVSVKMTVPATPSLNLSTTSLDFDAVQTQLTFVISNLGTGALNWSIVSDQGWLTANPQSGTNSGSISVTVNRNGLGQGSYSGKLTVVSNGGNAVVNVICKVVTSHASLSWKQVALPSNFQVKSMHYIAENNIWIAGYSTIGGYKFPRIYQFNGSQWVQSNVQAQDSVGTLATIAFRNNSEGWATSANVFYKYDGTSWKIQKYLPDAYGFNQAIGTASDVWFSGYKEGYNNYRKPLLYQWNGSQFTELITSDKYCCAHVAISDMDFNKSALGYCIDNDENTYMYNGIGWIELGRIFDPSNPSSGMTLSGVSNDDVWASDNRYLYHYNGVKWSRVNDIGGVGVDYCITQLRMVSSSEAWGTTDERGNYSVYYFDGTSWTKKAQTLSGELVGVKNFGNSNLWGIINGNPNKLMRLQ